MIVLAIIGIFLLAHYTDIFKAVPAYRDLTERELVQIEKIRRDAYDYAVSCSKTSQPALKFEDIIWELTPGDKLIIPTVEGKNVVLIGWFNPRNSTIYIPFDKRELFWLHAHESMHAIGYSGHPYIPFRSCLLMVDQNP